MAKSFLSPHYVFAALVVANGVFATPNYPNKFSVELPIPPVLQPLTSLTPSSGAPVDFYELTITNFTKKMFPSGLISGDPATAFVGYNGMYPGPTIRQPKGRESVVRFVNNGAAEAAIHLHGSATVSPFDGWAIDTIDPGQYKDYYYPNFQNGRTLWYHDHAHKITASNVRNGQAGFYILDEDEGNLGLPQGNYDVPLMVSSKTYDANTGQLSATTAGDSIEVNGQLYPFMVVEPRKYRFRFLNNAAVRPFTFTLYDGTQTTAPVVPLNVVGSDAGLLANTVTTNNIRITQAERYDIVIDFADFAGRNLTLRNSEGNNLSENLQLVMQFRVGTTVTDTSNNQLPTTLRTIDFLDVPTTTPRNFRFEFVNGVFQINGVTFSDPNNRVLANPPRGAVEVWNLIHAGGPVHPIHIHLVDLQIISRSTGSIPAYEAAALKDVIALNPGETVQVLAKYTPWDGLYMFHCHNLAHEDGEMMAAFNVTALQGLNYTETTRFLDPMDANYRAQAYTGTDLQDIQNNVLPKFKALKAYDDIEGLQEALDNFWGFR